MADQSEGPVPAPLDAFAKLKEIDDAVALLDFAVANGLPVTDDVLQKIKNLEMAVYRSAHGGDAFRALAELGENELFDFERAYRDLAQAVAPVTAETLRDTLDVHGRWPLGLVAFFAKGPLSAVKMSRAKRWSRILWFYTGLFLISILAIEIFDGVIDGFYPRGEETENRLPHIILAGLLIVIPFLYGGLGACAFLLRSCHEHIRNRRFDRYRIPEYYSRILLGIVSGGAILLFVEQIHADGEQINVSSAALGFLAGYNTDFLFKTVERVVEAILPKVGLETMRRDAARGTVPQTVLNNLLERLKKAQDDEEKAFLTNIINQLTSRR